VNLLDVEAIILGGGIGIRLGEPYAKRIHEAMGPHLFNDHHPPAFHVAALGDLGGAIGASLLVAPSTHPRSAGSSRTTSQSDGSPADAGRGHQRRV